MAKYSDNMKDEKKPSGIIPAGMRKIRVTEMIEATSKAGNLMFNTTIEDVETHITMVEYLISVPKKRWKLKSLLSAVGLPAGEDGVYNWDTIDVIGKDCVANVEHYQEDWINKEGNTVKLNKARVTEFLPSMAWEE
jgi:hypothetical protein